MTPPFPARRSSELRWCARRTTPTARPPRPASPPEPGLAGSVPRLTFCSHPALAARLEWIRRRRATLCTVAPSIQAARLLLSRTAAVDRPARTHDPDRQSHDEGKRVSVRVDHGGRRSITKKKHK